MASIYGDRPRPWILADGIEPESDVGKALAKVSQTVYFLRSEPSIASQVAQAEFDAYVCMDDHRSPARHLYVLQFGGMDRTAYSWGGSDDHRRIIRTASGVRFQLEGPDKETSEPAADLARRSLVPFLMQVRPRTTLVYIGTPRNREGVITSFVREKDGDCCAGMWARSNEGQSEWWWLPRDAPDKEQWVHAAFDSWRTQDPVKFPSAPNWMHSADWMTVTELTASEQLTSYERETEVLRAERAVETIRLRAHFESLRDQADQSDRRLLTTQGDDLVDEVANALTDLGFTVVNSDTLPANAAEKLEDLRISDAAWTALGEVKGYGGRRDARVNDLQQFTRPVMRYAIETSREPDALWYVVSQRVGSDPSQRPRPLASDPDAVQLFANAGGLVLDTADLYRLRRACLAGEISQADARTNLKATTGVFAFPNPQLGVAAPDGEPAE